MCHQSTSLLDIKLSNHHQPEAAHLHNLYRNSLCYRSDRRTSTEYIVGWQYHNSIHLRTKNMNSQTTGVDSHMMSIVHFQHQCQISTIHSSGQYLHIKYIYFLDRRDGRGKYYRGKKKCIHHGISKFLLSILSKLKKKSILSMHCPRIKCIA